MSNDNSNTPDAQEAEEQTPATLQETYGALVDALYADIRDHAVHCIDVGERGSLWQDHEDGLESSRRVVGWLQALATISEMEAAGQARWEMVSNCEHTQYAIALTDSIHSVSAEIKKLSDHLATLKAHYMAVLLGRRSLDVNYTSEDGDWVHISALDKHLETTGALLFNQERLQNNERIRRQRPLNAIKYLQDTHDALEGVFDNSVLVHRSDAQTTTTDEP